MARLQSDVSAGTAGKKGASTQNTGNDVGVPLPANAGIVIPPASKPLAGHTFLSTIPGKGNAPQRGPGKKTPANPTDVT